MVEGVLFSCLSHSLTPDCLIREEDMSGSSSLISSESSTVISAMSVKGAAEVSIPDSRET